MEKGRVLPGAARQAGDKTGVLIGVHKRRECPQRGDSLPGRIFGLASRMRKIWKERRTRSRREASPGPTPGGQKGEEGRASPGRLGLFGGSLTVECALVLPLFFLGMTAMISLMDLYRTETAHLTTLCQNAKVAATYTYNPLGGSFEDIVLPDAYTFRPVGGFFRLPRVVRVNLVKVRTWNGKEHSTSHESLLREKMVYVTATGTVYHRTLECRYLSVQVTIISAAELAYRTNHSGNKYTACEICAKEGPAPLLYVTARGDRYHNRGDCSSLKRTVRLIKESDAIGLRPCSVCGEG